ncbi:MULTISPECIES: COX15/CtaA family protein [unclassified Sporolactobacillus]|uniref:COX15/CtaA family protein n=1 Tax=unclassified Sporolactobacillus TaxID=2628533 RepID=UPI002367D1D0|nr:heme A synthase [Sporolactobacillus sp. CQH2019]MDD9147183.1 heme A synthase [Sporolactobacillus sp. CQH2019]
MKDRYLRIMSIAGVLSVLIVILMGALVTNTGSAYGCGNNWPLCNGQVIPTADKQQTWIEFSHRIVSGIASILTVVQAVWIWIRLKHVRETKFLAIASVFFIFLQAFLGAAAVVWGQSGPVLALHFGISLLSFASMLLIAFIVFEGTGPHARRIAPPIHHGMRWNFILLSIYSYILIYSGAFVRHTGSTLGSTDFPLINGRLFPQPLVSKAGVQYLHRVLAFIILLWLIVTLVVCLKRYKNVPSLSVTLFLSLIFVLLQSVSGIIIIKSHMALYSLILHSLFVTCFFGLLMILLMLSLRKTGGPEHR